MVKTRAKIWAIIINALNLFAYPQKPLYPVLGKPKPWVKNLRKKLDLLFLVKNNKNCQFWAKNH